MLCWWYGKLFLVHELYVGSTIKEAKVLVIGLHIVKVAEGSYGRFVLLQGLVYHYLDIGVKFLNVRLQAVFLRVNVVRHKLLWC